MNSTGIFLVICLLLPSISWADRCEIPSYVVPIRDIRHVLKACVAPESSNPDASLAAVNSLIGAWVCEGSERSVTLSNELQCVVERRSRSEAAFSAALGAASPSSGEPEESRCATARQKMQLAAGLGSGKAAYFLYQALVRGSYRGVCASENDADLALGYLEAASAAGISSAETELALVVLDSVDAGALERMDVPERAMYRKLSQHLRRGSSETSERVLDLLNHAARKYDAHAIWVLIQIYEHGILGLSEPALALAWASARDPGDESADFLRLYKSLDASTRLEACEKVRLLAKDNINLRFRPGALKNDFFLKCAGKQAIVSSDGCIEPVSLSDVEVFLAPFLSEYPNCKLH